MDPTIPIPILLAEHVTSLSDRPTVGVWYVEDIDKLAVIGVRLPDRSRAVSQVRGRISIAGIELLEDMLFGLDGFAFILDAARDRWDDLSKALGQSVGNPE